MWRSNQLKNGRFWHLGGGGVVNCGKIQLSPRPDLQTCPVMCWCLFVPSLAHYNHPALLVSIGNLPCKWLQSPRHPWVPSQQVAWCQRCNLQAHLSRTLFLPSRGGFSGWNYPSREGGLNTIATFSVSSGSSLMILIARSKAGAWFGNITGKDSPLPTTSSASQSHYQSFLLTLQWIPQPA